MEGPIFTFGDTNMRMKFSIGARAFMNRWNETGPTHHMAAALGSHTDTILKGREDSGRARRGSSAGNSSFGDGVVTGHFPQNDSVPKAITKSNQKQSGGGSHPSLQTRDQKRGTTMTGHSEDAGA